MPPATKPPTHQPWMDYVRYTMEVHQQLCNRPNWTQRKTGMLLSIPERQMSMIITLFPELSNPILLPILLRARTLNEAYDFLLSTKGETKQARLEKYL